MKKIIALILSLVLTLCFCAACGGNDIAGEDPGMEAVKTAVAEAADSDAMQDVPDSYILNTMKITEDDYSDRYVRISKVGTNINEFGVFKTDDADNLKALLKAYLEYRESIWMDEYLPEEHPKLENAEVWVVGNYVMYAILDSEAMSTAEISFKGCFEG